MSWIGRIRPDADGGVTLVNEDPAGPDLTFTRHELMAYSIAGELPGWAQDGMRVLLTPTDLGEFTGLDIVELDD